MLRPWRFELLEAPLVRGRRVGSSQNLPSIVLFFGETNAHVAVCSIFEVRRELELLTARDRGCNAGPKRPFVNSSSMRQVGNHLNLGRIVGTGNSLVFPKQSRDKHLFVCGTTGTGKSKFLESLIRQDIRSWFKSKSGMLVLDPHGSLYDSVMGWLARANVTRLPIIPIDLRQDDWVISYNALRRRDEADCSVVIDNFVQAMAHVWGAGGTDQTPRFARWAANVLRALYENDLTLLEAEYLIDHLDREARYVLMQKVQDRSAKRDWQFANELKPRDFETELGSTMNRLQRFLRNGRMRSMFGHSKVSLDLRRALDEGHIILVSLATAGAKVSQEDADLFATLLLSDLWTAALERDKRDDIKPFYLYLDEFQRFITPTIARNLDEARGFGLHLTMANQFPQQLLDQGEHGTSLYHSIMENASSKAVFRLQSEENLRPLAQWLFRGVMNPDEVKHKLDSTKVMGYSEVERVSRTTGKTTTRSVTRGYADSEVTTESQSYSSGESSSRSSREDEDGFSIDDEHISTLMENSGQSYGSSTSEGHQESISFSESEGLSESETVSSMLIPIMGKEVSHIQFRSLEEQLHAAMAALFDQEQREGAVRLVGMKAPVSIQTPTTPTVKLPPERMKRYVSALLEKWDFALPAAEAREALESRTKAVEELLRQALTKGEPETARRRIG